MTSARSVGCAAVVLAGGRGSRLGGVSKPDLVVGDRRLLDVVLDACATCGPVVVVGPADVDVPGGILRTREDPPFSGPAAALAAGLAVLEGHGSGAVGRSPEWVLCLGCDQPGAPVAVPALIRAAATASSEVEAISALAGTPTPSEVREVMCGERTESPGVSPNDLPPFELREETRAQRTESPGVRVGDWDPGRQIEWMLSILRRGALVRAVDAIGPTGLVDCSMRRLLGPLRWAHAPVAPWVTDDIDTWDDHARWQQRATLR